MRPLLDKLDPFFAAAAIVVAGVTVFSQVPYPIVQIDFGPLISQESSTP